MPNDTECFISIDVECSGPIPGDYSLLSIGACVVGRRDETFYAVLKPINDNAVPAAIKVTGFEMAQLQLTGELPNDVFTKFRDWVLRVSETAKPVFVGFNAGFDWSFVNWYFHHFLGDNPFGAAPLDIKAYYMGRSGCRWDETKSSRLPPEFQPSKPGTQHALADAQAQAEIFEKMLR